MAELNPATPGSYAKSAAFEQDKFDPAQLEALTEQYLTSRKSVFDYDRLMVDDRNAIGKGQWVRNAFLVSHNDLEDIDRQNTEFTTAHRKYTDTSPGGNYCINPRPLYTPYADPPVMGMMYGRKDIDVYDVTQTGMGAFYSEAQDDTSQIIHMRLGVTAYTGLSTFFTGFFSYSSAKAAKTGRVGGGFFHAVGMGIGLIVTIINWPLLAVSALGYAGRFFLSKPSSRYAYLKPAMHLYWGSVQNMLNSIVTNRGLYPNLPATGPGLAALAVGVASGNIGIAAAGAVIGVGGAIKGANGGISGARGAGQSEGGNLDNNEQMMQAAYQIDTDSMKSFAAMAPDIFSPDGGVDVYAVAGRALRLRNLMERTMAEQFGKANQYDDYFGFAKRILASRRLTAYSPSMSDKFNAYIRSGAGVGQTTEGLQQQRDLSDQLIKEMQRKPNFKQYATQVLGSPWYSTSDADTSLEDKAIKTTSFTPDGKNTVINDEPYKEEGGIISKTMGFLNALQAEFNDGTGFASFRVDYTGAQGDNFSNQSAESEIGQFINSASSKGRETSINFADGRLVGGAAGDIMGAAVNGIKDVIGGTLDWFGMSGLLALKGDAFVDIPKHWISSTGSLPRAQYTMTLQSPYGNVISQIINIYIPLCMVLAAGLPMATGRQSYTAPLMLELYDRGRTQTRYGMVDQISISRGTSNLGFTKEGVALAYEVSFSVVDLSSVVAMPNSSVFSLASLVNPFDIFDDETLFTDYMNVLGSVSMSQQVYKLNRLKLNAAKKMKNYKMLSSPYAWASFAHDMPSIGWLDAIFLGTDKV